MKKLIRRLIDKYYAYKMFKYRGTWRAEYYEYLKNFTGGVNWKKVIRPRFNKKLNEYVKNNEISKLSKKWLQIKFRIQLILFGLRDDEFFSMKYFDKPLFFSRKAMTKARVFWMDGYLNNRIQMKWIGNKAIFAELLGEELFGRKWLLGPCDEKAFLDTFKSCDKVIVKPLSKFGGRGINIYDLSEGKGNIWRKICDVYDENYIIEEYIYQKGFLHELNESSLNTIRVITIRKPGTQDIFVIDSFLRVGVPGATIDNYSSGGATYDLDINTGTIGTVGAKSIKTGSKANNHPGTDRCFTGLVIPYWDKILEACRNTHVLIPNGLDFIGWDVCLSNDKITFIEANTLAGFGRQYGGKRDCKWEIIERILDSHIGVKI